MTLKEAFTERDLVELKTACSLAVNRLNSLVDDNTSNSELDSLNDQINYFEALKRQLSNYIIDYLK